MFLAAECSIAQEKKEEKKKDGHMLGSFVVSRFYNPPA